MSDIVPRAEAFARSRHAGQTRKGAAREPYASHLEEVAAFVRRHGGDAAAIAAAWLHDTVEDCPPTSVAELDATFGGTIAGVVAELTDDKSLPKAERKRLQLVNAPGKSARAALVKIADKASNVRSVTDSTPADWDRARCLAYVDWADAVVQALPETHAEARAEFAAVVDRARAAFTPA